MQNSQFHVRLQNDVVVPAIGPCVTGSSSRAEPSCRNANSSQNSSVNPKRRGGSTSVDTGRRVPVEVEPDAYIYGDDEERLYSDIVQNLRQECRAEIQDEADSDQEDEEEDLPAVEWDPENPNMEEGTIFASMTECRNALVTYCMKAERTFEVVKSDKICYRVHCPAENCPWRMHASKM